MAELVNTKKTLSNLTTISKERLLTKLWRTAIGLGIGAVLLLFQIDPGIEKWGWVLVGLLVAGEWALLPLRLLGSAVQDVIAPSITAVRQALGK